MAALLDNGLFVLASGGPNRPLNKVGEDAPPAAPAAPPAPSAAAPMTTTATPEPRFGFGDIVDGVLRVGEWVSKPALFWHGLKRNDSIGWGLWWGIAGSMVWPFTVPYAFYQGFAKPREMTADEVEAISRKVCLAASK